MFLHAEGFNDSPETEVQQIRFPFLSLPLPSSLHSLKRRIIDSTLQCRADDFSISTHLLGFPKRARTSTLSSTFFFFSFPTVQEPMDTIYNLAYLQNCGTRMCQ